MTERPRPEGEYQSRQERGDELPAFHEAARFPDRASAGDAYWRAHELAFTNRNCDLSVYRLIFERDWHVAVLGETAPEPVLEQLRQVLATGHKAEFPLYLWEALVERRG